MIRDSYYGRPYIRMRPNSYKWPSGTNVGKNYFLDQAFMSRDLDARYANSFYTVYISNLSVTNTPATANNMRGIGYTTVVGQDTAVWLPDYEVAGAPQFVGTRPFKRNCRSAQPVEQRHFPGIEKIHGPQPGGQLQRPVDSSLCVISLFGCVFNGSRS